MAGLQKAIAVNDRVAVSSLLAEADEMGYGGKALDDARVAIQRSDLEDELKAAIR